MNRRSLRRIFLCLVVGLVILGCATPVLVTPPPSTPALEPIETIIVQTAAVAQTQTATVLPPTTTATITSLPSKTATITPTPTSTVVFLFPTETPWPEDLFDDEETDDDDGYEKPVVVREWDCRVLSQSPAKFTVMSGGSTFKAVWTVENTGTKTWPKKGVDIVYRSGAHLQERGAYYDIPTTVGPGGKVTITISMTAPKRPEVYSTRWSLRVGRRDFCPVRFIIEVK
ncbi:MAG: hypothetical protein JW963_16955 [Anaerolineales bacterium]|nr:hypothetical protein [Anaerolineales bacterium]